MGSLKTLAKFEALLESKEGLGEMEVKTVNCLGECGMGPNVQINGADGASLQHARLQGFE